MKNSRRCPKCGGSRIGHVPTLYDKDDTAAANNFQPEALGVAFEQGWLVVSSKAIGQLEAFVCGGCGFHETYVKDPQTVPFESIHGFRWL